MCIRDRQKDQDEFRRICNKLINVCFICRQNQATRSDFYFIQKYKEKFEELSKVAEVDLTKVMSGENGAERVKKYSTPMARCV